MYIKLTKCLFSIYTYDTFFIQLFLQHIYLYIGKKIYATY